MIVEYVWEATGQCGNESTQGSEWLVENVWACGPRIGSEVVVGCPAGGQGDGCQEEENGTVGEAD